MQQETLPIFASDYIKKVKNFWDIGVARRSNGNWQISGLNHLRTLRVPEETGLPIKAISKGIAGWRRLNNSIYLHLVPDSDVEIGFGKEKTKPVFLNHTNGQLLKWEEKANGIDFRIKGFENIKMVINHTHRKCIIVSEKNKLRSQKDKKGRSTFLFGASDTGNARLTCSD
jgi:hypothetical protein